VRPGFVRGVFILYRRLSAGFFFCASLFVRFPFCFQEFISVLPFTSILESRPDRSLAERLFSIFSAFSGLPVSGLSEVAEKYFWHRPVPSAGRLKPAPTKRDRQQGGPSAGSG
jgi:hypothetical protein